MSSTLPSEADYFRRDQKTGISPPNLRKECTFAEHVVHARGKRTQYTSVSLDLNRIMDFGDTDYRLERDLVIREGHVLVEHAELVNELRRAAREESKGDRLKAVKAIRYAVRRQEGLVKWSFDTSDVSRKDLIIWAQKNVQKFFSRI